jgi:hypothetical protein
MIALEEEKAALRRELVIAKRRLEKFQLRIKNIEKLAVDPAASSSG